MHVSNKPPTNLASVQLTSLLAACETSVTDTRNTEVTYADPLAKIVSGPSSLLSPPSPLLTFVPRTFLSLPLLVPLIGFAVHPNAPVAARATSIAIIVVLVISAAFAIPYRRVCASFGSRLSGFILSCQVYLAAVVVFVILLLLLGGMANEVVSRGVLGGLESGPTRLTESGKGLNAFLTMVLFVALGLGALLVVATFFAAPKRYITAFLRLVRYAPSFFILSFTRNKYCGDNIAFETSVRGLIDWDIASRPQLNESRWAEFQAFATEEQKKYLLGIAELLKHTGDPTAARVLET